MAGELYGPLRDSALFHQVRMDPEVHTLVWPNGGDFDLATFHNWLTQAAPLATQARRWEPMAAIPV